jgi:hypothetical protein
MFCLLFWCEENEAFPLKFWQKCLVLGFITFGEYVCGIGESCLLFCSEVNEARRYLSPAAILAGHGFSRDINNRRRAPTSKLRESRRLLTPFAHAFDLRCQSWSRPRRHSVHRVVPAILPVPRF